MVFAFSSIVALMLWGIHVVACLWWFIGRKVGTHETRHWTDGFDRAHTKFDQYIVAYHWTIAQAVGWEPAFGILRSNTLSASAWVRLGATLWGNSIEGQHRGSETWAQMPGGGQSSPGILPTSIGIGRTSVPPEPFHAHVRLRGVQLCREAASGSNSQAPYPGFGPLLPAPLSSWPRVHVRGGGGVGAAVPGVRPCARRPLIARLRFA